MSESMTLVVTALIVFRAYRFLGRPSWPVAAFLGAACVLAMLTRPEAVLFVPFLIVPVSLLARSVAMRSRLQLISSGWRRGRGHRALGRVQPRSLRAAGDAVERTLPARVRPPLPRRVLRTGDRLPVVALPALVAKVPSRRRVGTGSAIP